MADVIEDGPKRHDLDFGTQIVLWSIRLWVVGVCHNRPTIHTIDKAYTLVGCPNSARALNAVMQRLSQSARRILDIRPPCFQALSADEHRLLDTIRCYQRAEHDRPRFIISAMVYPHAAPPLLDAIDLLSRHLLLGGLVVGGEIAWRTGPPVHACDDGNAHPDVSPTLVKLPG